MNRKARIYISGPITTNRDNYEKRFEEAEKFIKTLSTNILFESVNPLKHGEPSYTPDTKWTNETWVSCMNKDINLVSECDAIALLPDWIQSKGSVIELFTALRMQLAIYSVLLHMPHLQCGI